MPADQSVRINRDYVRSFFDRYLLGKEAPLLDGPSPQYPEVEFDPKLTVTGAAAAPSRQGNIPAAALRRIGAEPPASLRQRSRHARVLAVLNAIHRPKPAGTPHAPAFPACFPSRHAGPRPRNSPPANPAQSPAEFPDT